MPAVRDPRKDQKRQATPDGFFPSFSCIFLFLLFLAIFLLSGSSRVSFVFSSFFSALEDQPQKKSEGKREENFALFHSFTLVELRSMLPPGGGREGRPRSLSKKKKTSLYEKNKSERSRRRQKQVDGKSFPDILSIDFLRFHKTLLPATHRQRVQSRIGSSFCLNLQHQQLGQRRRGRR